MPSPQREAASSVAAAVPCHAIFVLGFGDDETATVAHVLASLVGDAAPSGPSAFAELNDELLAGTEGPELADRAADLLAESVPGTPLVLADTRLARVLPFWTRACDHAGVDPAYVVPIAEPSNVVDREDEAAALGRLLAMVRGMLEAELATRDRRRVLIPYRALLRDWRAEVRRATAALGLNLPPETHRQAVAIDRFLTARAAAPADGPRKPGPAEGIPTWISRVHTALLAIETSEDGAREHLAELDAVRRELRDAELATAADVRLERLEAALASTREGAEAAEREAAELRSQVAALKTRLEAEPVPLDRTVQGEPRAARAAAAGGLDPFPFIVGAPRSGTTLLRALLDGHADLAVPPESHFVVGMLTSAARFQEDGAFALDRYLDELGASEWFKVWKLSPDAVAAELERPPASLPEALRATYRAYARLHRKPRYGDKTPPHVAFIELLAASFPEAVFIHLIRDGRDVATSLRDAPFGPDDLAEAAGLWSERVAAGRAGGESFAPERYREVRYEELTRDPVGVLEDLCAFIGIDFSAEMLNVGARADRYVSESLFPSTHRRLAQPISSDIRDWRRELDAADRAAIESVAGPLLSELGYGD